jgi:hypothetical protein
MKLLRAPAAVVFDYGWSPVFSAERLVYQVGVGDELCHDDQRPCPY